MNNELNRKWKETDMAKFKVLFQHFPDRTEENLTHNSLSEDRDLNPGPSEYEAGMLTTRPQRSFLIFISLHKSQFGILSRCRFPKSKQANAEIIS
jgi:hypothetical protein